MSEPINATTNAATIIVFSLYFCTSMLDGIDITPYAIKKANGKRPASKSLRLKSFINSGESGPMILVKKEITKNVSMMSATM